MNKKLSLNAALGLAKATQAGTNPARVLQLLGNAIACLQEAENQLLNAPMRQGDNPQFPEWTGPSHRLFQGDCKALRKHTTEVRVAIADYHNISLDSPGQCQQTATREREEGRAAFYHDAGKVANPYNLADPEQEAAHRHWNEGWEDAFQIELNKTSALSASLR